METDLRVFSLLPPCPLFSVSCCFCCCCSIPNGFIAREWGCWRAVPWELTNFHPTSSQTATQVPDWYELWVLDLETDHGKKQNAFLTPFSKNKKQKQRNGLLFHQEKNGSHGLRGFTHFTSTALERQFLSDLDTWVSVKCGFESYETSFCPSIFVLRLKKKVVSEAANPIWSPKPDVLYRIPKFIYTRSKLDILSAPQTNTRLYVVLVSLTLCSWFWWWCVSISVSPPGPKAGW